MWSSPIPEKRWTGFRDEHRGTAAFDSLSAFETAQLSELRNALSEHDLETLGRLINRGKKLEIEVFVRTHGPNPLFDPQRELEVPVGVARADTVDLNKPATAQANQSILNGEILHVLF